MRSITVKMGGVNFIVLAVCIVLCASQPVEKLPVLKEVPAEVLFRVGENLQALTLECILNGIGNDKVQYTWHKNGQPYNWQNTPNVVQRQNEGSLVFTKPTDEDEGRYQCFAESSTGVASSRVISARKTYINIPKVTELKHKPIEGRPFKLDCSIPDAYPKPTIVWVRQLGADPKVSNGILDKRITLSPDGNLWFSNVTREDVSKRFKYVCQAKTPAVDGEVTLAEHYIEDLEVDKELNNGELVPQYLSKDMTVKAGDVTMIYCIYGGTPLAHPDWFKEGQNVNNNPGDRITRYNRSAGKRLLIRETYLEDQGTYTCVVDNEVGKPQNHSMRLTVVSAPEFSEKLERQLTVKAGQDVIIPCKIKGVPTPKVSWTHNAKPLVESDRTSVNTKGSTPTVAVADLTIKIVQSSDKGYYGCSGTNENGISYAETMLIVV